MQFKYIVRWYLAIWIDFVLNDKTFLKISVIGLEHISN